MLPHCPPDAMRHRSHGSGSPPQGTDVATRYAPRSLAAATRCHARPRTRSVLTVLDTRIPGLHVTQARPHTQSRSLRRTRPVTRGRDAPLGDTHALSLETLNAGIT